jgi:hypothetical protein
MNHDPNLAKYQDTGYPLIPAVGSTPLADEVESLPDRT